MEKQSYRYHYNDKGDVVPKHHAKWVVETTTYYSIHQGRRYLSRSERVGWPISNPKKTIRLKNRKERDVWLKSHAT